MKRKKTEFIPSSEVMFEVFLLGEVSRAKYFAGKHTVAVFLALPRYFSGKDGSAL